jgi:S-adenosylmethionine decarboxylase
MKGLHLTADLYRCRCDPQWLLDADALQAWCISAAQAVGLVPVAHAFHGQRPGGAAVSLLLEGGHVCLHAWAAEKAATLDVYVTHEGGDRSAKARGLMDALVRRFQPEWTEQRSLDRGEEE